jgi:1,4-alpha-glucan branching enzyme
MEELQMLKKTYAKSGESCRVTFKLPAEAAAGAEDVNLVGAFNEWDESAHALKRRKDGSFSTTISLTAGQSYRFRYLIDGTRWENDDAADGYAPNEYGSDDSIIEV